MIFEPIIVQAVAHNCVKIVERNAPKILMIVGIGGMGASTVMAVKATPKANAIYKQITRDPELSPQEKNKEIFKRVVPLYAPAALAAVCGATCVVGSYSINMARLAELGAAYAIAQNNLTTYRKQVEKKYGSEVEKDISETVIEREKERAKEAEQVDDFVNERKKSYALSDPNETLFYDRNTGKPYSISSETIGDICLELQHKMDCGEMLMTYAELETALDPDRRPSNFSEEHGWIAGDIIRPVFSEWYITKDGNKYREFEIDTNPQFSSDRKLGDIW